MLFVFSALIGFHWSSKAGHTASQPSSLGLQAITESTHVSAFIGEFRFTLRGYTSPGARVILEGLGIYDETYANAAGEFVFLNRFSPLSPREACITAHDTDRRISNPLCLPPFSVHKNVSMGPILLPPTVSLNQDQFSVNDYGILTGKAAPDSEVDIDIYTETTAQKLSLTAQTDESGSYSLTLPTEHENTLRIFSINYYRELISDKSNTLTLAILPIWKLILKQFSIFFGFLKKFALPLILLFEGLILLLLFLFKDKARSHPLALRTQHPIITLKSKFPTLKRTQELVKQVR